MSERIGFIGLGVMGRPMAENLIRAGFRLTIQSRTRARAEDVAKLGAKIVENAAAVAAESDVVISMVPDTSDVELVYFGPGGVLESTRPGHLFIDMSTVSPAFARRLTNETRRLGADALDAPVSGGEVGARDGNLSIMVGGSAASLERARPLFQVMGHSIVHMGEAGAGQITKACNQVVVALTIEAVGEAFTLAEKAGVDRVKMRQALLGGLAQSRVLEVHGQRMLDRNFEPGFRLRLHRKDLTIALEAAQEGAVALPHTALMHDQMNHLVMQGRGELDHSAILLSLITD